MKEDCAAPSGLADPRELKMECPETQLPNEPSLAVDACVPDADGDRIGGFLWKFPSEGSNASPGGDAVGDEQDAWGYATYPRKCRHCTRAWVSSYVNERRHWKQCTPEAATGQREPAASLGLARRVWCEVDDALTALQWREGDDGASPQQRDDGDAWSCIAFRDMADVAMLHEPRESFQITTTSGRRVVFQCRAEESEGGEERTKQEVLGVVRALDARQWSEYLSVFSRFALDQEAETLGGIIEEEEEEEREEEDVHVDLNSELLCEITRAIVARDVETLEVILNEEELGATRTLTDGSGSSLLVVAIRLGGDERIVQALIKAGVDCNAKNHDGETPLLLAAASGDLVLMRLLLRSETIVVNQRCAMGATAFHAAANAGEVGVLRMLCEQGTVTTTYVDENGWTPLHYAAACATGLQAMQFLCELLPELVDAKCIEGNTALHVAAGYGCVENARVLLQTAANPHIQNADGHTAYHVALHNNHIACALAVNEYMDTPRDAYERVVASQESVPRSSNRDKKQDRISRVEATQPDLGSREYPLTAESYHGYQYGNADDDTVASPGWMEYQTDDRIPYFYNHATGVSTWHKPETLSKPDETRGLLPPPPPQQPWHLNASDEETVPADGQKLPLCMIPLVSPLTSLDDPTAATKLDSRRKKERARRRSRVLKQRVSQSGDPSRLDTWAQSLPPPPPPPVHKHHQRRRTASIHHYEVQ